MLYLAIFLHCETIQKHSILSQALLWFCHFVMIFCPFSQVTLKSELALRKSSFCAIQLFHSSHCLTFPQVLMVNQVLTACSWYDCALLWSVQTGSILQRFAPHDAVSCRAENLVKLVFDKDSQKDLGFVICCTFSRAAIHDMFSLMKQSMYVSPSTHHRYSQNITKMHMKQQHHLQLHSFTKAVLHSCVSHDMSTVATATWDGALMLWWVPNSEEVCLVKKMVKWRCNIKMFFLGKYV